jgi:uncharacterized protein (TIGR00297 family)
MVGGVVVAFAPPAASWAVILTAASSSALTRLPGALDGADSRGRDLRQVLANGAVAALGALWHGQRPRTESLAFIGGALAAATADTWATELGTRYGGRPRLITDLRPVPAGTDGGVTPAGVAASLAGACVLSAAYTALLPRPGRDRGRLWAACAAGGVAGSVADSLLGATLEASPGRPLDNDGVNALNTLVGAATAALLHRAARHDPGDARGR